MKDIRIGNDIIVKWSIFGDDAPYILEGKDVSLYLCTPFGKRKAEGFSILGNQIAWTFTGKDQNCIGKYSLELIVNKDKLGQVITDACNFVNLVSCSCKAGGADEINVTTESIELTSELGFLPYDDTEIRNEIKKKQDALVSGKNIKTINGQSLLGEGDIVIVGGGGSYDDTGIKKDISDLKAKDTEQDTKLAKLSEKVDELDEKVDELGEGVKEEVFWVEYGKTTYEDVKAAAESGKIVICVYDTLYYRLVSLRTDAAFLACDEGNYHYRLTIAAANSGYARISFNRGHNIKDLDNGNVEIEISGKKREVATPQYVESLLGTIINGEY